MHEASFYKYSEKIKKNTRGKRWKVSGRSSTATTTEYKEEVEELILSHDEPGSHLSIRQIAPQLNISKRLSIRLLKK